MSDKILMTFEDGHGKKVTREINQVIDVREFFGTPAYSSLVIAANTRLSVGDIKRFLDMRSVEDPRVYRPRSWIQRRRWTFQQADAVNESARSDRDGNYSRAVKVMRDNTKMSLRTLSLLLKERGINRSREWIRRHRCD